MIQKAFKLFEWWLPPLAILKQPFQKKLYLQGLFPLLGLYNLTVARSFSKTELILYILPLYGFVLAALNGSLAQAVRSFQLALIISAFHWICRKMDDAKLFHWLKIIAVSTLTLSIVEFLFFDPYVQGFQVENGLPFDRYGGVLGEPNYSAFISICSILLFAYLRKYWWVLLHIPPLLLVGSRTGYACLAIFLLAQLVSLFNYRKLLAFLSSLFIVVYSGLPLVVHRFDAWLPTGWFEKANYILSERLSVSVAYSLMFWRHPWGVGYFNGKEALKLEDHFFPLAFSQQQHSLMLQILSELGWVGFAATFTYLVILLCKSFKSDKFARHFVLLIPCLTFTMFIDVSHELLFYVLLGVIVRDSLQGDANKLVNTRIIG